MRKFALLAVAGAALFATAGAASAQAYYYSGPGYGVYIGPRYEEPRYRYRDPYYRDRHYRDPYYSGERYSRERYYRSRGGKCPPHYTVQDGVCKPYRGY